MQLRPWMPRWLKAFMRWNELREYREYRRILAALKPVERNRKA